VSVNVQILQAANWSGVARAARGAALGVLVAAVLAMPFGVGAVAGGTQTAGRAADSHAAPTADRHAPARLAIDDASTDWDIVDATTWAGDALAGPASDDDPTEARFSAPAGAVVGARQSATGQSEADDRMATLERLLATERPARDPVALASRIAGHDIPWTATRPITGPLAVGDRATFYVLDQTDNSYKERQATLRLVSEYAYWYVQDDQTIRDEDLAAAAQQFDQRTVPTVHRVFGTEWSPGIDGDTRITLFLGRAPGVAAYFSSWDEYPRSVFRFSNEREMIHFDLGSGRPGSTGFGGTLAHEFQHMVHWHVNTHDDTWVDEGFAELSSALATGSRGSSTGGLERQPDTQLTTWAPTGQTGAHYAASFLFAHYLAQRFGEAALGQIIAQPGRPPDSITAYLSQAGLGISFDDVFEDWLVANLLDDPSVGDGRYAHTDIDHHAAIGLTLRPDGQPADQSVHQYGAQYVELQGDGSDAELVFDGAPSVRLVGTDATSGRSLWWSNRADGMDSTLTHSFDLSGVTSATLNFKLWYDTERDFDFCYVMVSTDGGTTWQVVRGAQASDANPTGNALGPGYSGKSGVPAAPGSNNPTWISDTVDLTPFAGQQVLVRFEYVTDQGYNAGGVALDDVEVPEIGFRDDVEADAGWTAEGFLRSANEIPQTWSLQLVEQHQDGSTTVRPLRADGAGHVTQRIAGLGGDVQKAILVVSGLSPRTLETAPYTLTLRPASPTP
jgi:hypothetical protein